MQYVIILKKTKITIPDLSQVKALCIDDFAKNKNIVMAQFLLMQKQIKLLTL